MGNDLGSDHRNRTRSGIEKRLHPPNYAIVRGAPLRRWITTEALCLTHACFDALWTDILEGRRRFKLYRQLKMYNDPALNPAIYGKVPK